MEKAVDNRLAELESRLAALESALLSTAQEHAPPAGLRPAGGAEEERDVGQGAAASVPSALGAAGGERAAAAVALGQLREREGWAGMAGQLAALGNPVRLTLLQEISRGRATVSALSEVEGLGTSGQIYHHLRQLTAEGWLHTPSRGTFAVPPPRVVALLAILEALQR
ncbi:winged helix-turn-helix domain-containing protein [Kribbella sp. NPDC056861]|uniref:ArsR/SmtB family transcription factor n=1 Tax=Kribbella sp. NPDC056861 TaxID=3154857 RepID=UPI003423E372